MKRREVLLASGGAASLAVAGCVEGSDATGEPGQESSSWEYDETVSSDEEDIHEAFVGELEEGDEIEVEVVVNRGRHTRFELLNRDTGEFSDPSFVYRASEIEEYDPDKDNHIVSPFRETLEIPEFGEYYARVTLLASGLEAELRFRKV